MRKVRLRACCDEESKSEDPDIQTFKHSNIRKVQVFKCGWVWAWRTDRLVEDAGAVEHVGDHHFGPVVVPVDWVGLNV